MVNGPHGAVVGCFDGLRYRNYQIQMQPGSKLFLYTDGLAEAMDADGRMFGMDRILEALSRNPDASVEDTIANMQKVVDDFTRGTEQFDDLTMLCLAYHGPTGQK